MALSTGLLSSPSTAGSLLSTALGVYRGYPLLFLTLGSAVIVPFDLITLGITGGGPYSRTESGLTDQVLVLVFWLLIGPLVSALHIHAVAEIRHGRDPKIGSVAVRGLRAIPVVAAATVISGLGITLGLVALIVPGVILLLRWAVVAQAAAIEDGGWRSALRRSNELTIDHYGHVFAFVALLALITLVPAIAASVALFGHRTTVASFLGGLFIHTLVTSFGALATALLYYELRARRKE